MKNVTKEEIIKMLYGVMTKAETLSSIEEKKKLYHNYLERNVDFLNIDEEIDINSEEIDEIISDNFLSIKIEQPKIFVDDGYTPWLADARADISWDFYNRYEKYLIDKKKWQPNAVCSIKQSSDIILDHIANPRTDKFFQKKGLVMGDIQSGKTANYTAVINKAIDAGYKIIIVLAGMTRDLRNQTQNRIDLEVLGWESKGNGRGKTIGVGLIKQNLHIEGLTWSDEEKSYGDMKKYFSKHTLDKNLNPIVAIVKKNVSVLTNLNRFLTTSQEYCYSNGKLDIPVLIIDDEVDQASVDTKNSESVDKASAINRMIRTILDGLNRYSYIGYTATPFANVFIDPDKQDLYPKDFILAIPTNPGYCGIKEYFGVDITNESDYSSDHTKDLVVNIDDYGKLFEDGKKVDAKTSSSALNNSLQDAIKSFILASSIKKQRGIVGNNTMLIHISRFKHPATTLKPLVEQYLTELYHKLKYKYYATEKIFKNFWEKNFKNVSERRMKKDYRDSWEGISKFLLSTVESTLGNIKVLNGDSGDVLDYSLATSGDYVVIGGDKLSRGLTLEGLVVSYYYRNTRMYDSLLQMGRWFGYRKGWLDVCRVYTTVRFMNDFISVGKVLQKFRSDLDDMFNQRLNPRDVGQRIMYSPNLIPTSLNKMRSATKIKVSFSGQLQQVITFDKSFTKTNFDLTDRFIASLKNGNVRDNNKVVFKDVKPEQVIDYLSKYKDCNAFYEYGHISVKNWINYIQNLTKKGELTNWTVILSSLYSDKGESEVVGGYKIYKHSRMLRDDGDSSNFEHYTVKVMTDPADFREFFPLDSKEYKTIKVYEPSKDYKGFDSKHGILSIYVADLFEKILTDDYDESNNRKAVRGKKVVGGTSVCAPAIWFPKTEDYDSSATSYYVSKDYKEFEKRLEEEYDDVDGE